MKYLYYLQHRMIFVIVPVCVVHLIWDTKATAILSAAAVGVWVLLTVIGLIYRVVSKKTISNYDEAYCNWCPGKRAM